MKQSIWETLTIELLKKIELERKALEGALNHLERLEEEYEKTRGPVLSKTPIPGGELNKEESRRIDNIALRAELETAIADRKRNIEMFDNAWEGLDKNEQIVLTYFFISRPKKFIERLMDALSCEKTTVYRIKDEALYKMTMLIYGRYM